MNLIDALLGEHGVLYAEAEGLDAAVPAMDSAAAVQAALALFAAGVRSHSSLEDELLFASVERRLGGENGVVRSMRRMHADIDTVLERLRSATGLDQARDLALSAVALVREHFGAEEEACFPLAEEAVPEPEMLRLGRVWAERRGIGG